jgi:hypothetical protein
VCVCECAYVYVFVCSPVSKCMNGPIPVPCTHALITPLKH